MKSVIIFGVLVLSLFISGCAGEELMDRCIGCCIEDPAMDAEECDNMCDHYVTQAPSTEDAVNHVNAICEDY